ncbi:MAG: ribonuclease III [Verrucomicrobia bacterium]|nr:ribonuclease III [Pseudomonadota bacterium]NBS05943.1 ribonuclease III [Verrucomicrobiota bacterium]NBS78321.1 ribonuclease III [bacterium]NBS49278.1 ribonuclease III [Verrucomicrobiota bacterium]NBT23105.1 ribonuclease III [bacterium]
MKLPSLGHSFQNPDLLARALTHPSARTAPGATGDNQQLEFLGDAILQAALSDLLVATHPASSEGELTAMRASLANRLTLAELGRELGLSPFLRVGADAAREKIHESTGALADVWEAILGAIFLDAGYNPAKKWAAQVYGDRLIQAKKLAEQANPKGQLQELLQSRNQPVPVYDLVESVGPDHEKIFTIRVLLDGKEIGRGTGRSRKSAESTAATHALEQLA